MSDNSQSHDKFHRPEIFLSELLQKGARGDFHERDENSTILYRATVIAVDVIGGKLQNANAAGSVTHEFNGKSINVKATHGPDNPRNSIKARVISSGHDKFTSDEDTPVFWPFFPEHMSVPIKPGEHVYVIFEDHDFQHGLWVCKIPGHEGVNFVQGEKTFKPSNADSLTSKFPDSNDAAADKDGLDTDKAASECDMNQGKLASLF
jgi:hypothetical protein